MKLTDKAKEEFEDFFIKTYYQEYKDNITLMYDFVEAFYTQPQGMQIGVYEDFFDSVGIVIDIQPTFDYDNEKYTSILDFIINVVEINKIPKDKQEVIFNVDTRQEARIKAIAKANEIFNLKQTI